MPLRFRSRCRRCPQSRSPTVVGKAPTLTHPSRHPLPVGEGFHYICQHRCVDTNGGEAWGVILHNTFIKCPRQGFPKRISCNPHAVGAKFEIDPGPRPPFRDDVGGGLVVVRAVFVQGAGGDCRSRRPIVRILEAVEPTDFQTTDVIARNLAQDSCFLPAAIGIYNNGLKRYVKTLSRRRRWVVEGRVRARLGISATTVWR